MKVSLPFRDAEGKSDSGGRPLWNSGEAAGLGVAIAAGQKPTLVCYAKRRFGRLHSLLTRSGPFKVGGKK
jgi:hypothetical protein